MAGRYRVQHRPRRVEQVVDGDDGHVEQVGANHVGYGHIHRPQPQGGKGDSDFGQGGAKADEQGADEALPPAGDGGNLLADNRQPGAGADD